MYKKLQKIRSKLVHNEFTKGNIPARGFLIYILEKILDVFEWYKFVMHLK